MSSPAQPPLRFAAALSTQEDSVRAAETVCARCLAELDGAPVDLAVLFFSADHLDAARALGYLVRRRLGPRCFLAVSAQGVAAGDTEIESGPGISLFAGSMPGVGVTPFLLQNLPAAQPDQPDELRELAAAAGMGPAHRGTILLADPYSVPINAVLPVLTAAAALPAGAASAPPGVAAAGRRRDRTPPPPIIGGMASASPKPGENVLILNDEAVNAGGVGVSLSGAVQIDSLVSQGCRPFGQPMVITSARNQIVQSLGGRRALDVLHDAMESLDDHSRNLLKRGLFLGRAINEYKDRFGRGDFLVRNVIGVDQNTGAMAVSDLVRVGQTVQFHLRDAATAEEDLALLLDAQKLYDPPAGTLLFTCNGRGTNLFSRPHHDASAIVHAFAPVPSAESRAKGGRPMSPDGGASVPHTPMPLAGFFAAGEIGPIGGHAYLHGHTACAALFRPYRGQ